MARRQFKIPFAATGDTESIPNETQPDGSVSMQQGYGFDYQRDPETDPLAKVFPRDVHNGILNEITASIGEIQQQGYPIWSIEGAPYPINAVVRHNDANWQSNIATNNDEPGVGPGATSWKIAGASVDKFNAPIATIASAATVNLTTSAPGTSQVTITGSTTITGFTVAAGRAFVVKFTGSPILTNSAAIVTGRGANIQIAAGDSVIIRATANNVVEILPIDLLSDASVGTRGQSWVDVLASRSSGTVFTNTTGRPIMVVGVVASAASASCTVVVSGVTVSQVLAGATAMRSYGCAIVPPGETYSVTAAAGALISWTELR